MGMILEKAARLLLGTGWKAVREDPILGTKNNDVLLVELENREDERRFGVCILEVRSAATREHLYDACSIIGPSNVRLMTLEEAKLQYKYTRLSSDLADLGTVE